MPNRSRRSKCKKVRIKRRIKATKKVISVDLIAGRSSFSTDCQNRELQSKEDNDFRDPIVWQTMPIMLIVCKILNKSKA